MHPLRSRTTFVSVLLVATAATTGAFVACAQGGSSGAPVLGADGSADTSTYDSSSSGSSSSGGGGGCDAETQTDPDNCGSCGHECPSDQICVAAQCQIPCSSPTVVCPGTPGCFNLQTDMQNCGTCGTACLPPSGGTVPGTAACVGGKCLFSCPDAGLPDGGPIVQCGADGGTPGCFDLTSSSQACGSCTTQCTGSQVCSESQCCPAGDMYCNGACTDVQTDNANCGSCGAVCNAQCNAGTCQGYVQSNPTGAFIDACTLSGSSVVLKNQSDWETTPAITLPFTFTYYGQSETEVFLATDGAMGFGAPSVFYELPQCGQAEPFTSFAVALAFGDENLETGAGGVCYATTGTAPNQQFVATWEQASYLGDTGATLTFSIVLTQTTNTIDFMYGTASGADGGIDPNVAGTNATVLIQYPATPELVSQVSCNKTFIPSTPFDVRFTPAQ